jgi:hypothetical protein
MIMASTFAVIAVLSSLASVAGFYLPGVAPHSFNTGDKIDLKVNKLR